MPCEKCGTKVAESEHLCKKCKKAVDARNNKSSLSTSQVRKFYIHSGKVAPQLVIGIPILLVVSILLSFIYAYSSVYIPYFYVKALLLIGFVLGIGFSIAIVLQFFKTRNTIFAICFGLLSGIVTVYVAWMAFEYVLLNKIYPEGVELMRLAFNPNGIWRVACDLAISSQYSVSGLLISGSGLWILWGIEAGIIIITAAFLSYSFIKNSVFCEACKGWTEDHKDKLTFEYLSERELKEKLSHQDMSFLNDILEIAPTAESFYRIDCRICCTCENLYTLSLLRVTRIWSKEGNASDQEKVILKNLFICKETFDQLTEHSQVISTPTPVDKEALEYPIPDE